MADLFKEATPPDLRNDVEAGIKALLAVMEIVPNSPILAVGIVVIGIARLLEANIKPEEVQRIAKGAIEAHKAVGGTLSKDLEEIAEKLYIPHYLYH